MDTIVPRCCGVLRAAHMLRAMLRVSGLHRVAQRGISRMVHSSRGPFAVSSAISIGVLPAASAALAGPINKYCFECHNPTDCAGGVAFDAASADDVPGDREGVQALIGKLWGSG